MNIRRWAAPATLVILWQGASMTGLFPAFKLPSPLGVAASLVEIAITGLPPGQRLHGHLAWSLQRVVWGYAAAIALALPLGVVAGWKTAAADWVEPIAELLRPVPPLAWIPLAILWFGIGSFSAGFIIFLGAFFPVLLSTIAGVRSVPPILIEAAKTLNATDMQILTKVLVPWAVPDMLTGARIGMGVGWMTLVAAEFTGVRQGYGLGYLIMTARDLQRPDAVLAGMAVIGLTGFVLDALIRLAQRHLVGWRPT